MTKMSRLSEDERKFRNESEQEQTKLNKRDGVKRSRDEEKMKGDGK